MKRGEASSSVSNQQPLLRNQSPGLGSCPPAGDTGLLNIPPEGQAQRRTVVSPEGARKGIWMPPPRHHMHERTAVSTYGAGSHFPKAVPP